MACAPSGATEQVRVSTPNTPVTPVFERPADTTFQDVLAEYQAFNERLERVSAPLRTANAALCEATYRDPGFSLHRLSDYPTALQPIAQILLNLSDEGLHIRSVRPGTSAANEKLQAGDRLVSINGQRISSDKSMQRYNKAVLQNGFALIKTSVTVETEQGRTFTVQIKPETACDAPARVVFSEDVNGHTDGDSVLITSALMRNVPDDTSLALVVAHEMGHLISGHFDLPPSQDLELEADRMALVLMARAGYDVEGAVAYWDRADHPHEGGSAAESSHPTTQARYENFRRELDRIESESSLADLTFQ